VVLDVLLVTGLTATSLGKFDTLFIFSLIALSLVSICFSESPDSLMTLLSISNVENAS